MARLWRGAWAALLLLCANAGPALASDGPSALAWLEGRWRGTGTMFGRASEAVLEVRPALDGRFVELSAHGVISTPRH
jgi:hypothetical protein